MKLQSSMEQRGRWLFRWRSYPPLIALAVVVLHLYQYHYLGGTKTYDDLWQLGCVLIAFMGLGVRAHVVGHAPKDTSGRNAREQRAEVLNTTGMYSVVRHPLYVGNFLIFLGTVSFSHDPWAAAVCVLGYWLYYERIMLAEEAFLAERFGAVFEDWAARAPAIIPDPRLWCRPSLPFSLRNVLRREYNNVFGVVVAMFLLDAASDSAAQHHVAVGRWWSLAFIAAFLLWLVLRTLKRRTEVLRVSGR
jgi:protein-S-isoprenylcysteine O-methyltransferase Ste14